MNTAELARELHVATRTITDWRHQRGLLPDAVTAGGHARWDVERVKRWVKEEYTRHEGTAPQTYSPEPPEDAMPETD